jgi:hypothetical protein
MGMQFKNLASIAPALQEQIKAQARQHRELVLQEVAIKPLERV